MRAVLLARRSAESGLRRGTMRGWRRRDGRYVRVGKRDLINLLDEDLELESRSIVQYIQHMRPMEACVGIVGVGTAHPFSPCAARRQGRWGG